MGCDEERNLLLRVRFEVRVELPLQAVFIENVG